MKHNCVICGKQELDKDTIGINKKLLGTDIENFYCMECLAEYLECLRGNRAAWMSSGIYVA